MARFFGNIGFAKNVESPPGSGIYKEEITLKPYYGDTIRDYPKWDKNSEVCEDVNINNKFSIVADSFFRENLGYMRFIEYRGFRWKINSAEDLYPRIILYAGGLYNG